MKDIFSGLVMPKVLFIKIPYFELALAFLVVMCGVALFISFPFIKSQYYPLVVIIIISAGALLISIFTVYLNIKIRQSIRRKEIINAYAQQAGYLYNNKFVADNFVPEKTITIYRDLKEEDKLEVTRILGHLDNIGILYKTKSIDRRMSAYIFGWFCERIKILIKDEKTLYESNDWYFAVEFIKDMTDEYLRYRSLEDTPGATKEYFDKYLANLDKRIGF